MPPSDTQAPASPVEDDKPLVYTMRELNQQTSRVLEEIRKYERPGLITKRGRFEFLIVPLPPGEIESEMAQQIASRFQN